MDNYEICTNSYSTSAFDADDSKSTGNGVRGSLHGAVKSYSKEEIAKINEDIMASAADINRLK